MKQLQCLAAYALVAMSCNHYYYGPNTSNIPLLKEKNDGRLNFNYFITKEASGVEFQGAFAVGNKTAVMLNFINVTDDGKFLGWDDGTKEYGGSGAYVEVAGGYFSRLHPSDWVFETYAGIGMGSIHNTHEHLQRSKVGVTKFFVQPSIGWASRGFQFGFSARLAYVNLRVKSSTVTEARNIEDYFDIEYIRDHRSGILLEPALMIRSGPEGMKFSLSYTGSSNLNRSWKQEKGGFSFGICIPFHIIPGGE